MRVGSAHLPIMGWAWLSPLPPRPRIGVSPASLPGVSPAIAAGAARWGGGGRARTGWRRGGGRRWGRAALGVEPGPQRPPLAWR